MSKEMYDRPEHVKVTFDEESLSEDLREAQRAEFHELKGVIGELAKRGKPIHILDIGVGNARVLKLLAQTPELWKSIEHYEGIDVAQNCVDLSQEEIEKLAVQNKTHVQLLDATHLERLQGNYDLIFTTWFTAGNFYPTDFDFEKFEPGAYDLSKNDKFTSIFRQAYQKLNPGGEIVIGSMYINNESTRKKQEAAYRDFGWEVITDERDSFTASKDGWWSQRFTEEQVRNYLSFVPPEKISFIPLDSKDYAMMVRIKK